MNNHHLSVGRLLLAMSGTIALASQAAIPDSNGVIQACYNAVNGGVRIIDAAAASCKNNEVAIQWNVQGPMGPQGPVGATGAQGPEGPPGVALAWAHVRADGSVDQDSGNITVAKVHAGGYCIGVTGGTINSAVVSIDSLPNMSGAVQVGVFHASVCPAGATDIYVVTRENAAIGGLPGQDRAFYILVN